MIRNHSIFLLVVAFLISGHSMPAAGKCLLPERHGGLPAVAGDEGWVSPISTNTHQFAFSGSTSVHEWDGALNNGSRIDHLGAPMIGYEEWAGGGLTYLWNAMVAKNVKISYQHASEVQLRRCFYWEGGQWNVRSPEARRRIYLDEEFALIPAKMEMIGPYLDAAPVVAVGLPLAALAAAETAPVWIPALYSSAYTVSTNPLAYSTASGAATTGLLILDGQSPENAVAAGVLDGGMSRVSAGPINWSAMRPANWMPQYFVPSYGGRPGFLPGMVITFGGGAKNQTLRLNLGGEGEQLGFIDVNPLIGNRLSEGQIIARNPNGGFIHAGAEDLSFAAKGSVIEIIGNAMPSPVIGRNASAIASEISRVLAPGGQARLSSNSAIFLNEDIRAIFVRFGFEISPAGHSVYLKK